MFSLNIHTPIVIFITGCAILKGFLFLITILDMKISVV